MVEELFIFDVGVSYLAPARVVWGERIGFCEWRGEIWRAAGLSLIAVAGGGRRELFCCRHASSKQKAVDEERER
jgi:hypothetical protein